MVLSSTARVIPSSDVFARIATREPYFALKTLAAFRAGTVVAVVPIELKSERELGPITAGEAARHLGLLATCALAEVNRDRSLHYYVAREATLTRSSVQSQGARLEAKATGELHGDDAGSARATLHLRGGAELFSLEAEFSILSVARFQKLFESVKRDLRKASRPPVSERRPTGELKVMRNNPYGAPLAFSNIDLSPGVDLIEASFGPISPAACNGHYPMYPVLPTGIVMSALSQLCGELLQRRKGEVKYLVRHAAARADNLAVVGETVRFEARYVGGSSKNHRFECKARAGQRPVGAMALTLQIA